MRRTLEARGFNQLVRKDTGQGQQQHWSAAHQGHRAVCSAGQASSNTSESLCVHEEKMRKHSWLAPNLHTSVSSYLALFIMEIILPNIAWLQVQPIITLDRKDFKVIYDSKWTWVMDGILTKLLTYRSGTSWLSLNQMKLVTTWGEEKCSNSLFFLFVFLCLTQALTHLPVWQLNLCTSESPGWFCRWGKYRREVVLLSLISFTSLHGIWEGPSSSV